LFVQVVANSGISNAGRPFLPARLVMALLYLKHAFNEGDEAVILHWNAPPTLRFFFDGAYCERQRPSTLS
jgi:IS5 family transposase